MSIYRTLWEEYHNQKIPSGYHIHHIDGNHNNNSIENLMCVSNHVHWCIHLLQGDPVALRGKFIQGASAAGKIGGKVHHPIFTPEWRKKLSIAGRGRKKTQSHKDKIGKANAREYVIITPSKEKITISNLRKWCLDNNLSQSAMTCVAQGKRKHHKKYTCSYSSQSSSS